MRFVAACPALLLAGVAHAGEPTSAVGAPSVDDLAYAARAAGQVRDCDRVRELGATVLAMDPRFHAEKFVRDGAIASCLPRDRGGLAAKLGIGLGVPYGGIGAGAELGVPHFGLVAGLGTTVEAGMGIAAGARVYLLDRGHVVRPHLTAVYGIVGVLVEANRDASTLTGFGGYVGVDHDPGAPGGVIMTYGAGVIRITDDIPDDVEVDRTAIKLLLAVNYEL